jgi:hypothetical protein
MAVTPPRPPAPERSVDAGDQLLAVLNRHARARFGDGPIDPEAPLFLTPAGARVDLCNFRARHWVPTLQKAGLAYGKPYERRHPGRAAGIRSGGPSSLRSERLS